MKNKQKIDFRTITAVATKTFYYGYDGQRILMVSKEDDVEMSRKYYAGEYEYSVNPSNNKKEVSYILSPTGLAAADVKEGTESVLYYILTDQLGSITQLLYYSNPNLSSTLLSAGKFTYDAWGRLRDVTQTSDVYDIHSIKTAFSILDRGYCGHEHLLDHAIINMNGRIYDPITAQFMQADNFIQTPEDYIGYNRYAYCRYNPFKYVDPSGEMLLYHFDDNAVESAWFNNDNPATTSQNALEEYVEKVVKAFGISVIVRGGASEIYNQLKDFLLSDQMKAKYVEMTKLAYNSDHYEAFILGGIVPKWGWKADGTYGIFDYSAVLTPVTLATEERGHVKNGDIQSALEASNLSSKDVFLFLHTHESGDGFSNQDFENISTNTFNDSYAGKMDLWRDGSIFGVVTSSNVEVLYVSNMQKYQDWQRETYIDNHDRGSFHLKGSYINFLMDQNDGSAGIQYYKYKR